MKSVFPDLFNFATACRNPDSVKNIVTDSSNVNQNSAFPIKSLWGDLAMVEGYPSLIIFFATLDHLFPEHKWDVIAHSCMLKIKESIDKAGVPKHASLYGGLAGLCHAIRFASKQGTRYEKILHKLDDILLEQIKTQYILPLKEQILGGKATDPRQYELIQGVSGVGLYLLQKSLPSKFREILEEVISLLIALTHPIRIGNHEVPGWYIPYEMQFSESDKKNYPAGNFNMGLSHGITGVLGFLAIASLNGINLPNQKEAMQRISHWLTSKCSIEEEKLFYKARVAFEEEVNGIPEKIISSHNREAWCYGTPGVARVLYLAGKALHDDELKSFSIKTFSSLFERPRETWNLPGPTICHGIAGLLLVTHFMAEDSQNLYLISKKNLLQNILTEYFDPNTPFGFTDFELCKDQSYAKINMSGLLTGAVGVWLSLLTVEMKKIPNWYFPFMVNNV